MVLSAYFISQVGQKLLLPESQDFDFSQTLPHTYLLLNLFDFSFLHLPNGIHISDLQDYGVEYTGNV